MAFNNDSATGIVAWGGTSSLDIALQHILPKLADKQSKVIVKIEEVPGEGVTMPIGDIFGGVPVSNDIITFTDRLVKITTRNVETGLEEVHEIRLEDSNFVDKFLQILSLLGLYMAATDLEDNTTNQETRITQIVNFLNDYSGQLIDETGITPNKQITFSTNHSKYPIVDIQRNPLETNPTRDFLDYIDSRGNAFTAFELNYFPYGIWIGLSNSQGRFLFRPKPDNSGASIVTVLGDALDEMFSVDKNGTVKGTDTSKPSKPTTGFQPVEDEEDGDIVADFTNGISSTASKLKKLASDAYQTTKEKVKKEARSRKKKGSNQHVLAEHTDAPSSSEGIEIRPEGVEDPPEDDIVQISSVDGGNGSTTEVNANEGLTLKNDSAEIKIKPATDPQGKKVGQVFSGAKSAVRAGWEMGKAIFKKEENDQPVVVEPQENPNAQGQPQQELHVNAPIGAEGVAVENPANAQERIYLDAVPGANGVEARVHAEGGMDLENAEGNANLRPDNITNTEGQQEQILDVNRAVQTQGIEVLPAGEPNPPQTRRARLGNFVRNGVSRVRAAAANGLEIASTTATNVVAGLRPEQRENVNTLVGDTPFVATTSIGAEVDGTGAQFDIRAAIVAGQSAAQSSAPIATPAVAFGQSTGTGVQYDNPLFMRGLPNPRRGIELRDEAGSSEPVELELVSGAGTSRISATPTELQLRSPNQQEPQMRINEQGVNVNDFHVRDNAMFENGSTVLHMRHVSDPNEVTIAIETGKFGVGCRPTVLSTTGKKYSNDINNFFAGLTQFKDFTYFPNKVFFPRADDSEPDYPFISATGARDGYIGQNIETNANIFGKTWVGDVDTSNLLVRGNVRTCFQDSTRNFTIGANENPRNDALLDTRGLIRADRLTLGTANSITINNANALQVEGRTQLNGVVETNLTANRVVITDAQKNLAVSVTTDVEVSKLSGIRTDLSVQQQLDNKVEKLTNIAANQNKVIVSDNASGMVTSANITTTELDQLDGINTNETIQVQLNKKVDKLTDTAANQNKVLVTNNASSIVTSTNITTTELDQLNGINTNETIQAQLNSKQGNITGGASSIVTNNLTLSRALVSDASGKVSVSAVSSTELGYVSGVTSGIQTQLNSKLDKDGFTPSKWLSTDNSGAVSATDLPTASSSVSGILRISDSTSTTSSTVAASSTAVKSAYDLANGKLDKDGFTPSKYLTTNISGQVVTDDLPSANAITAGILRVNDGISLINSFQAASSTAVRTLNLNKWDKGTPLASKFVRTDASCNLSYEDLPDADTNSKGVVQLIHTLSGSQTLVNSAFGVSNLLAGKLDKNGWTANRYLGTDSSGNIAACNLPIASTTDDGIVRLVNSLTSTSTSMALTAAQGKALQDNKLEKDGHTANRWLYSSATGIVSFCNLPIASTSDDGIVRLNNTLTSTATNQALTAAQGKDLQDNKLDKEGHTANRWLFSSSTGVVSFCNLPVGSTSVQGIVQTVNALSSSTTLVPTAASVSNLLAGKLDSDGLTANRWLATNNSGLVVTCNLPVGSTSIQGIVQTVNALSASTTLVPTAASVSNLLTGKLDKDQGTVNSNQVLCTDATGNIVSILLNNSRIADNTIQNEKLNGWSASKNISNILVDVVKSSPTNRTLRLTFTLAGNTQKTITFNVPQQGNNPDVDPSPDLLKLDQASSDATDALSSASDALSIANTALDKSTVPISIIGGSIAGSASGFLAGLFGGSIRKSGTGSTSQTDIDLANEFTSNLVPLVGNSNCSVFYQNYATSNARITMGYGSNHSPTYKLSVRSSNALECQGQFQVEDEVTAAPIFRVTGTNVEAEFPPSAMSASTLVSTDANYGGTYTVSASSTVTHNPWLAFDNNSSTRWRSGNFYNTTGNFDFASGAASTTFNDGSVVQGEWLQLQLPFAIHPTKWSYTNFAGSTGTPDACRLVASVSGADGSWVQIGAYNPTPASPVNLIAGSTDNAYSYYRWIFRSVNGSSGYCEIAELNIFGIRSSVNDQKVYVFGDLAVGTSSPTQFIHGVKNQNEVTTLRLENDSTGTLAQTTMQVHNSSARTRIGISGTGYDPGASGYLANSGFLETNSANGLGIFSSANSTKISLYTGGTNLTTAKRMEIDGNEAKFYELVSSTVGFSGDGSLLTNLPIPTLTQVGLTSNLTLTGTAAESIILNASSGGNGGVAIRHGNDDVLNINPDGNFAITRLSSPVGIGTSSSTHPLTVYASANGLNGVRVISAGAGSAAAVGLFENDVGTRLRCAHYGSGYVQAGHQYPNASLIETDGANGLTIGTNSSSPIRLCTGSTSVTSNLRMLIDGNGLIGVGTATPEALLHTYGSNTGLAITNKISSDGLGNSYAQVQTECGTKNSRFATFSSTYTSSAPYLADSCVIQTNCSTGLVYAVNATSSAQHHWYVNGNDSAMKLTRYKTLCTGLFDNTAFENGLSNFRLVNNGNSFTVNNFVKSTNVRTLGLSNGQVRTHGYNTRASGFCNLTSAMVGGAPWDSAQPVIRSDATFQTTSYPMNTPTITGSVSTPFTPRRVVLTAPSSGNNAVVNVYHSYWRDILIPNSYDIDNPIVQGLYDTALMWFRITHDQSVTLTMNDQLIYYSNAQTATTTINLVIPVPPQAVFQSVLFNTPGTMSSNIIEYALIAASTCPTNVTP